MKKILSLITFFIFTLLLLTFSIKGNVGGNPVFYQNESARASDVGGPFESSNNSSRYALTEAIVENKSFSFGVKQIKLAGSDLAQYNGKVFTLFTPGVSFISVPFYILGKQIGLPQIFAFYSVTLFALLNVYLVYHLARKLDAGFYPSLISGFIFLFATNAFPYAVSFTQHHMSTAFILLALINILGKRNLKNNMLLGVFAGAGILMDIPNIILMTPIFIYAFIKQFQIIQEVKKVKIAFNPSIAGFLLGIIPFIILFAVYNHDLTGSYNKLAQFIGRVDIEKLIDADTQQLVRSNGKLEESNGDGNFDLPFDSRRLLSGFYTLLISDERSWLYYSPIVLAGIAGFVIVYRKRKDKDVIVVASSVVLTNILLYAMFHDPWGGWSFGGRYLIPAAAILSVGIASLINKFKKNYFFIPIFFLVTSYSIGVSTLGALTTSVIPPKVEAENLSVPIPHTYQYNINLLETKNHSGSLFYNLYFSKHFSSKTYVTAFVSLLILTLITMYVLAYREKSKKEEKS